MDSNYGCVEFRRSLGLYEIVNVTDPVNNRRYLAEVMKVDGNAYYDIILPRQEFMQLNLINRVLFCPLIFNGMTMIPKRQVFERWFHEDGQKDQSDDRSKIIVCMKVIDQLKCVEEIEKCRSHISKGLPNDNLP